MKEKNDLFEKIFFIAFFVIAFLICAMFFAEFVKKEKPTLIEESVIIATVSAVKTKQTALETKWLFS